MEPSRTPLITQLLIPLAIVVGFGLIAAAIYFSGFTNRNNAAPTPRADAGTEPNINEPAPTGSIRPVDATDYIRGNPNAPILIVEYSDYDCPFCKQFHTTMQRIIDEYGVDGRVAWVYRQFPLEQLHPNAPRLSEAALCVGDIGGNEAFWNFSDAIFDSRELNELTNVTRLNEFVTAAGVSIGEFESCMTSGRMKDTVTASLEDGFNAGVRGTPHSIVLVGNQQATINGAQPYAVVKSIVDNLIQQLDGQVTPPVTPES
jgi:protein-disulfide isomerase